MSGNGNGKHDISIYVLPTEEGQPPRAVFLVDVAPGVHGVIEQVAYVDGAWRHPNGDEVLAEIAESITEHAESLGVEWDH